MTDFTTNAVVGGVKTPRILEVGENACTDPRLANGLNGWTSNDVRLEISRIYDEKAYEEYMLRLYHNESLYTFVQYTTGWIVAEYDFNIKKVLVAFRIKDESLSDGEQKIVKIELANATIPLTSREIVITNKIKRIAFVFEWSVILGYPFFNLRFYTGNSFNEIGDIRIDDIYINVVIGDYNFECSDESNLTFEKTVTGQHELIDGKIQEYNKRWKPNFFAHWTALNRTQELYRQSIAETINKLFIIPHIDFLWGFFGIWDVNFERKYSFNRFISHDSSITIKGNEYLLDGITPATTTYEMPVVVYNLTVGSFYPESNVFINISPLDYNNQSGGSSEFIREYSENTVVSLVAPSTIIDGAITRNFVHWIDGDLNIISSNIGINITMNDHKEIYAVYDDSEDSGNYGDDYGSETGGYGDYL